MQQASRDLHFELAAAGTERRLKLGTASLRSPKPEMI